MATKRDLTTLAQQQAATIADLQRRLGVPPSAVPVPAPAATAAPSVATSWLAEANVALIKAAPKAKRDPRPWAFVEAGESNAGFPKLTFAAPMKNGKAYLHSVPGDLVDALLAGKVAGYKRS